MVQDQEVPLDSVPGLLLLQQDQPSKLLLSRFTIITTLLLLLLLKSVVASAVAVLAVLSPLVWPWVLVLKSLTRPLEALWEAAAAMEMLPSNSSRHLPNSQFSMLSQLNTLSPFMSSPLSRWLNSRIPA